MLKVYARVFTLTGAVFFAVFAVGGVLDMLTALEAVARAAAAAVLGGAALSAIMGTLHIRRVRALAGAAPEGDIYAVTQKRVVKMAVPADRAYSLMEHYLGRTGGGFTLTRKDQAAGSLYARTAGAAHVATVAVEIHKDAADGSEVTITVRPLLPFTPVDFGRSLGLAGQAAAHLRAGTFS